MKAIDLNTHLNSLFPDIKENTVDRVIYGDPDREVAAIAVAWMPYRQTIQQAIDGGANVLVTHEPTFYIHRDLTDKNADTPEVRAKREWLDNQDITIIRCHDVWDAIPDIGIPYAWGEFLDLGKPSKSERYYNVYDIDPQTAGAFSKRVASRTAALGQPTIEFYGDLNRTITSVGLGTGCISKAPRIRDMGADLAISVDDVVRAWIDGEVSQDTGYPLIVVNHCVSEEPGIVKLAEYIDQAFPDLPVTHIPQTCTYASITA
jgi:putative NIF3 family GTP cyclohydrolase 1 type 2